MSISRLLKVAVWSVFVFSTIVTYLNCVTVSNTLKEVESAFVEVGVFHRSNELAERAVFVAEMSIQARAISDASFEKLAIRYNQLIQASDDDTINNVLMQQTIEAQGSYIKQLMEFIQERGLEIPDPDFMERETCPKSENQKDANFYNLPTHTNQKRLKFPTSPVGLFQRSLTGHDAFGMAVYLVG